MRDLSRKIGSITLAVLAASFVCACGSVTVNVNSKPAEEPAKEETAPEETAPEADKAEDTKADANDDNPVPDDFPVLLEKDYDMSRYLDEDKKEMYFECHGNEWYADDKTSEMYPKLASALEKIHESEEKDFETTLDDNDKEAKDFANEHKGEDFGCFYYYSATGPACVDDKVVSLLSTCSSYLGGAHPSSYFVAYNIDPTTGEEIPLSNVISDQKGLNDLLKENLESQYKDHSFFDLDESLDMYVMDLSSKEDDKTPYVFTFSPNGLTFYFDAYALSPYADGDEQINFTYDDLASVLKEGYGNK